MPNLLGGFEIKYNQTPGIHYMYSSSVMIINIVSLSPTHTFSLILFEASFCFFDYATQRVGSQFPDQGLNPGQGSESTKSDD